ncbi:MAG TPA: phenylalanine--tRNA ligase subunit beta [Ktedonobacterales bacterium]|nr:phenylalanine--tRNA ligase subunit beta [Ktedonobacterales bacterium]
MRVPYNWLKDYVNITLSPEELAERLTMAGLEVDRVEYPWPGIVTAQIIWLERVKGSDHLSATRVTDGTNEYSVVCGASNIKLHDKVPLARLGARVGEIVIAEKMAMGVLSQGMLCSPRELGLSDDHSGIYILPKDTPLGIPLGKLLGDAVIDLDIKAHRGDLFCVVGVAREVAAFTGETLRLPETAVKEKGKAADKQMTLEVRDADLCPRYTARVVRDVKIGPSPQWMANRLTAAGMRPINNVVDITNYVMLELGQPLHAFDYDKVTDHTIIVRRATPGEQLTTLDDVTRTLTNEMLLITDPAGPTVIAGIFGGSRVEVSEETTNILLEAAHFAPGNIRRTSQALGLRTESSGRFEKNPDINLTAIAIDRAARLLTELAGATVAPGRVDFYPKPVEEHEIDFAVSQVEWLTGMQVTPTEVEDVLRALGFGVAEGKEDASDVTLRVTVPTRRHDVEEGADIVEEVARIVGFDRIPGTIPSGPLPTPHHDIWYEREERLRDVLVGAGLTEIVSYPLTSRERMAHLLRGAASGEEQLLSAPVAAPSPGPSPKGRGEVDMRKSERRQLAALAERLPAITLVNPASAEVEALRLTLMASLLETIAENSKHESAGLWFFELGRRYLPTDALRDGSGLPQERQTLGVGATGPMATAWTGDVRTADFFAIKGIAELLLTTLKVADYRFVPGAHPTFHPGRCAILEVGISGTALANAAEATKALDGLSLSAARDNLVWVAAAVLGEVHPEVAERFDLTARTCLMELDLERLYLAVPEVVFSQAVLRYPAAQRDLAVVVDSSVPAALVLDTIRAAGSDLLRSAVLFDVYTGKGIPAGKKNLAYALTYQSPERTLTDQEVERAHAEIVKALAAAFGAELRA